MARTKSTIGERIRAARVARNLSQDALGDAVGVRGATISRYESDDLRPTLATLEAIADELGASFGWLGAGEGRPPRGVS